MQAHVPDWKNKKYLLGVSGGRDSVALVHLFHQLGLHFEIAHCNFQLRDQDADDDADFVQSLAQHYQATFHLQRFDTKGILNTTHGNLQETARNLRYDWFQELIHTQELDYIAVGTHQSDVTETVLLHLLRGSGIRGLHGILPVRNAIIRPLLAHSRTEIDAFVTAQQLNYREDKSNADTKYRRNRIRHRIVPELQAIQPNAEAAIYKTTQLIQMAERVIQNELNRIRPTLLTEKDGIITLDIKALKQLDPMVYYTYELLRPFSFNADVAASICESLTSVGAEFESPTHRLLVDRDTLTILPLSSLNNTAKTIWIQNTDHSIDDPIALEFTLEALPLKIPKVKSIAALDFEQLQFPLELRPWQPGDRFTPFGMKGHKKVSDFLIDIKMPRHLKDQQYVLLSGGQIVWLVGQRIDARYAIQKTTKKVYFVTLTNAS